MRIICIVLLGLSYSTPNLAQKLQFKVIWKGDSSGYVTATKSDSIGFEVYKINSKVTFWLFGNREIDSFYISVYKDGQLIKSKSTLSRDGKLREKTTTRWVDEKYTIIRDDKVIESVEGIIEQSIARLYFYQPQPGPVYSERFGEFLEMQPDSGSVYHIVKPDGRKNTYSFGSRYCKLVEVDNWFATLYFVRIAAKDVKL